MARVGTRVAAGSIRKEPALAITLYHSLHSTCSQKVRLLLAEKKLAWKSEHLNLRVFDQLTPEFLRINPSGLVPVLVHDGFVLSESRVISEYLEDAFPTPSFTPPSARDRARMRQWTRYVDVEITEAIKLPSFARGIVQALQAMPLADALAQIERMPDKGVRRRWRHAAEHGLSAEDMQPSVDRLLDMLNRMDAVLGRSRWLAGDDLSLADLDTAPFVHRLARIDLFDQVMNRPNVATWFQRLRDRPVYASAMPEFGT